MNKKILIIHPSLGLGGAEKIIGYLSNLLSEYYDVTLLLLKDAPTTLNLDKKIQVMVAPCYDDKPIVSRDIFSGINKLVEMRKQIKNIAIDIKPDLIVCFDLRVLLATCLPGFVYKTKVLFSERADPYENTIYWRIILKYLYKKVDGLVFQTEGARQFYGSNINLSSTVIHNPALMRIEKSLESVPSRKKYLFAAGRFQYRKGFDLLIKAFAQIADKYPEYTLYIYGSGEEENNLKALIKLLNMEKQIALCLPTNGVVEKNYDATLFVIPSRSEGIPNILIEAMVVGIPAVAADCSPGGASLLSDNGKNCLLAKNDDVNSLSECIDYALSHSNEMQRYADAAKNGLSRFDKNVIGKQWLDYISKIMGV